MVLNAMTHATEEKWVWMMGGAGWGMTRGGLADEVSSEQRSEASAGLSHWIPQACMSRQRTVDAGQAVGAHEQQGGHGGQSGASKGASGRNESVGSYQVGLVSSHCKDWKWEAVRLSDRRVLSREVAWSGLSQNNHAAMLNAGCVGLSSESRLEVAVVVKVRAEASWNRVQGTGGHQRDWKRLESGCISEGKLQAGS